MSVPIPHRSVSKTEFLDQLYDLNVIIGGLIAKMPPKYRPNYGDTIVSNGLKAMHIAMAANGIYISIKTPPELMIQRIELFNLAKGYVVSIPTLYQIYLSIYIRNNKCTSEAITKFHNSAKRLSDICNSCTSMMASIISYDKRRYREIMHQLETEHLKRKSEVYNEYYNNLKSIIDTHPDILSDPKAIDIIENTTNASIDFGIPTQQPIPALSNNIITD